MCVHRMDWGKKERERERERVQGFHSKTHTHIQGGLHWLPPPCVCVYVYVIRMGKELKINDRPIYYFP